MKKTYVAPAVEAVKLNAPLMAMSTSIVKASDESAPTISDENDVFSNSWKGGIFDTEEE